MCKVNDTPFTHYAIFQKSLIVEANPDGSIGMNAQICEPTAFNKDKQAAACRLVAQANAALDLQAAAHRLVARANAAKELQAENQRLREALQCAVAEIGRETTTKHLSLYHTLRAALSGPAPKEAPDE